MIVYLIYLTGDSNFYYGYTTRELAEQKLRELVVDFPDRVYYLEETQINV